MGQCLPQASAARRLPAPTAILFDLDDTLVASASTWQVAETVLLRQFGRPYEPAQAHRYKGLNALDVGGAIWDYVRPAGMTRAECGRALRALLLEEVRHGAPQLMPGAAALLARLGGRYRLALASGSPPEVIALLARRFGWDRQFAVLLSSEEVPRGKPAPDVFLAAATRLGVAPAACLVVEDSAHGVAAARAAGMRCVAVNAPARWPELAAADRCCATLAGVGEWLDEAAGPTGAG